MPTLPLPRPTPVARQALLGAGLLILIVGILLAVAQLGFQTLSSARAYVGGEGLWSKAQKDAAYSLVRYLYSEAPADYAAFQAALEVNLGDQVARLELERATPDLARVRQGFLRGGNHPDDVDGMATFFRRFRRVSFVAEAIDTWARGDALIAQLLALGAVAEADVRAGRLTPARRAEHLARLSVLAAELTRLEDSFSAAMGAGARWAARVLLGTLVVVALVLVGLAGLTLWRGQRRLEASERSLREEEARSRALVDGAPLGIARTTIAGEILAANPALVRILGYDSFEQLRGTTDSRALYVDPTDRDRLIVAPAARGEPIRDAEFEVRRRDGVTILVRCNGRALRAPDGGILSFELFIEDITAERVLEAQLRQAQKMEAVGQLTGGIAHDFNNILTIILSTARLLDQDLPDGAADAREDLAELRRAAERGAEMIRKLLAFSRAERLSFEAHQLEVLLTDAAGVLTRVLPATLRVELVLAGAPTVRADPALFEQMLLNLATNARDAMPGGGTLTLTAGSASMDAAFVTEHGWGRPGSYGTVTVRDTGVGMTQAVIDGAFVPFFTTKPPGQGTGLGLPMVYGLMKQHGGFVELQSGPGRGTTVTLYFPAVAALAAPPRPAHRAAPPVAGTVLLVEDEPGLRRAAQRILEQAGFDVLPAADGQEALACYTEQRARIRLVLSDVVMPRLGGSALYRALQELGSTVPFVFMSGYPARDLPDSIPLPEGVPLLAKPWEPAELVERVRAGIASAQAREAPHPDADTAE